MTEPLATSDAGDESRSPAASRGAVLRWLLLVVAAGFVVSSLAPGLPPGWKRLGLMYAAIGGLIGAAAGALAIRERQMAAMNSAGDTSGPEAASFPRPRRLIWLVLLAALGALVNTAVLSARQHRLAVETGITRDPRTQAYLQMLKTAAKTDPESAAQLAEMNRRMGTGFRDYLAFRFSQLTSRAPLSPEVLWGIELALGLLAAGVTFRMVSKMLPPLPDRP